MIFIAVTSLVAWVTLNPPQGEQFASISVLNQNMEAYDYFPANTTTVQENLLVSWNIQVYNHMGTVQYILIIIRLSNATLSGPNATARIPGSGPIIANFTRVAMVGETWNVPLQWSIVNDTTGSLSEIQTVKVNNQASNPNLSSVNGKNYRIVIELWTYDVEIHGFIFSYRSQGMVTSIWNQLWFNV